ncbi:uncharacterized protein LOC141632603 [Silene latifolia]|uniref:uncharacterized protein LOC141632603 n=1 Tax=Silene latifolia TaxID=37657 RepID=UPI003D76A5F7
MWSDLEEHFAVVDGTSIHSLKTELGECRQKKCMSVTEYYGKLKSLWDALSIHEPPFACEYGKCTCDIAGKVVKRLDNERLHQFFMGLNRSLYGTLQNQQFQLVPLPSLNRGYHATLQAERLLMGDTPPDVSDVVAYATPGSSSRTPDEWKKLREKEKAERRKLYCSHYEVHGHDINSCFIKSQKFPDWWGSRPRTLPELCRSRKSGSTNTGTGSGSDVGSGSDGTVHANALQNIPSDRLSGTCVSWIIDTGASNHVIGDLSFFADSMVIPPRAVGLPNGKRIMASRMGTVKINDSITLRRVLFVPHLTCHLISVSQLTVDYDYMLQFTKDRCLIQDRSLRKMIGVGELQDGLFILSSADTAAVVHTLDTSGSYELWHRRLGHPEVWVYLLLAKTEVTSAFMQFLSMQSRGDKFEPRSRKCIFLGYPLNKKGWKVLDIETRSIFVSRDVIFHEELFHQFDDKADTTTVIHDDPIISHDDLPEIEQSAPSAAADTVTPTAQSLGTVSEADTAPATDTVPAENIGRGHRLKFPNSRLQGYVLDTINSPSIPDSPDSPTSLSGTSYALANFVNCNKFSTRHKNFLAAITTGVEPPSFKIAIQDDGWCKAMKEEIDALESNDTWELTDLPLNKKALGCRWVYKIKYKFD